MKQILILILCAFVLSCKSTKTASSSNESERNAVSQAQWRSAQNLSFSSLQRLTALSFDSCVVVFGGADTSATPLYSSFSYPSGDPSASFKAKPSTSHGNATDFVRGEPCSASHPTYGTPSPSAQGASSPSVRGQPQTLKIYGLHLSTNKSNLFLIFVYIFRIDSGEVSDRRCRAVGGSLSRGVKGTSLNNPATT